MKNFFLVFLFFLVHAEVYSQERIFRGNFLSVGVSYLEIKDELNHGLVFKGPDVSLEYGFQKIDSTRYFGFSGSLSGGGKTAVGSWGFRWSMSPINTHYLYRIGNGRGSNIYLGPSFQVSYNVQNYSEMHAGPIIWMTSYDLGIYLSGIFKLNDRLIEFHFRNTLGALSGRPEEERDPYYFSTNFGENFSYMHSNMVFGTVNSFNQTELGATLFLSPGKRAKAISYHFQYTGYFNAPEFRQLSHSIEYTWFFKK